MRKGDIGIERAAFADKACIVGIGETEYRKRGGWKDRSEFQLLCEAIMAAAEDGGISVSDIDGLCSFAYERHHPGKVACALGIPEHYFANQNWGGGGGGGCAALANAALAIHGGICKYVVIYRALCQGEHDRYGQYHEQPHFSYQAPFGYMSPAQSAAILFRRYMHVFGVKEEKAVEAMGHVAVAIRENALRNPRALQYGKPLTLEQHHASRMIADPFRLFDLCLETDGAAAIIVTSPNRARDCRQRPVRILGAAQASGPGWGLGPIDGYCVPAEDMHLTNSKKVADAVYGMSGLKPSDIDVAQFYDAFTGSVIRLLGDYGFCAHEDTSDFVIEGNLRYPDGKLPCNTSGGHLSHAYLMGFTLVLEGVRQMRGTSTSQVENAQTCFCNSGASNAHSSAVILGR